MSEVWLDSDTLSFSPHQGHAWNERLKGKKFDSYLGKSSHPTQNHALIFLLRIYLNPVSKQTTAKDSPGRTFPVKEWTPDEWSKFKSQFVLQSHMWNNRFWLIPPKTFSLMDVQNGGRKVRPNIVCRLITEIVGSPSTAHKVIQVVNLDTDAIKKQTGKNPTGATFRSNDGLYDSLDVQKRNNSYTDDRGVEHTIKNYYTVAHEIGHAIGLPHVGVLKSRPQCMFAIALANNGVKNVSSHLSRGSNSKVCYGKFDNVGLAENIMGLGTKFEEFNAKPWVERVVKHTNSVSTDWKIVLSLTPPKAV
jgi:hypothetical protein